MHGIEEGSLDKGCAEASDLLYIKYCWHPSKNRFFLFNLTVRYSGVDHRLLKNLCTIQLLPLIHNSENKAK
jgi:hypothetical protein